VRFLKAPVKAFYRAVGHIPVTIRGQRFKADPYHLGFWNDVNRGVWEQETFEALSEHLSPNSTFVDVGAWIGPMSMFASRKARRILSVEPDPFAYECLLRNIQRNQLANVTPFPLALGAIAGPRTMFVPGSTLGNSRTTLLASEADRRIEVTGMRWQDWMKVAAVDHVDFIKIDIEGGEFELLPTMKEYLSADRPILHLSVHAPFLEERARAEKLEALAEALSAYAGAEEITKASERFASYLFTPR
jgi:FkbM family methyltransferase